MPEETMPTIRPRSFSAAKSPTSGKIICPDTVTIPNAPKETANTAKEDATAEHNNPATVSNITVINNLRRSRMSPKGTMSKIPKA